MDKLDQRFQELVTKAKLTPGILQDNNIKPDWYDGQKLAEGQKFVREHIVR
jgi:hypothetical protein